ncbi:oligosaccharide flippase family protein [Candidatus Woesearchaeota archaeon]|nr:oligosaccharide flippase family protein [Candidatus Woesearchaeota archaeon]
MILKNFLKENKFFRDSVILFIAFGITNLFNYGYHFFLGRALGPEKYGIVGALLSLLYIFTIFGSTIQSTVTKFVAEFKAKREFGKIKTLFVKSFTKFFYYSFFVAILFVFAIPWIKEFLNIESSVPLIILAGLIVTIGPLASLRGILQGTQHFSALGWNMSFEALLKFSLAILLISFLFFGVNGAILALLLPTLIMITWAVFSLRKLFNYTAEDITERKSIYLFSIPMLMINLSVILLFSFDVILVKHYFSALDAGLYVAVATLAKIVYFGSQSFVQVMFPKISEVKIDKEKSTKLLKDSLFFVMAFSIIVLAFYIFAPKFIVGLLFGSEYLQIADFHLWFFAIGMMLLSLNNVLMYYNMSLNRVKVGFIVAIFTVITFLIIILRHNSIFQVIEIITLMMLVMFFSLVLYTLKPRELNFEN